MCWYSSLPLSSHIHASASASCKCISTYILILSGSSHIEPGVCDAVASAEKFSARNIANTLWALAKMMHNPGDTFLNSLGAEAGKKVTDFNAQNHANTVWAFATLGRWCAWHCCKTDCSKDAKAYHLGVLGSLVH